MRLFNTFFIGGFECADPINHSGKRLNLLHQTGHHQRVRDDYEMLARTRVKTVREGICWSSIEKKPFVYDFSEVENRIEIAHELGVQQIWDICHFGFPDGLSPMHPQFAERFAALCQAFAWFYRECTDKPLFVVPINEISFFAWYTGKTKGINAGEVKYQLCKAAIAGIKALKDCEPQCRIMLSESMVNYACSAGDDIDCLNANQFQTLDMIAGYTCPELGGDDSFLDILGFGYNYDGRFGNIGREKLQNSLATLLQIAYCRYNRPIVISETGPFDAGNEQWIVEITSECINAMLSGVDIKGICIPATSRPDWETQAGYHHTGLWVLDNYKNRLPRRLLLNNVLQCQHAVSALYYSHNTIYGQQGSASTPD